MPVYVCLLIHIKFDELSEYNLGLFLNDLVSQIESNGYVNYTNNGASDEVSRFMKQNVVILENDQYRFDLNSTVYYGTSVGPIYETNGTMYLRLNGKNIELDYEINEPNNGDRGIVQIHSENSEKIYYLIYLETRRAGSTVFDIYMVSYDVEVADFYYIEYLEVEENKNNILLGIVLENLHSGKP